MKNLPATFAGAAMLLLFLPIFSYAAPATAENASASVCQFDAKIKELASAIANHPLDEMEELLAELKLRKSILKDTIDCALIEVDELYSQLNIQGIKERKAADMQARFLSVLDEATQYYERQRSRIADLGLRGTKDLAKEIADWRSNMFSPQRDRIVNFVLWTHNQPLFAAATARRDSLGSTMRLFKILNDKDVQTLFNEATNGLAQAQNLNTQAESNLFNFSSGPQETLALIQNSLRALADTYQKFLELSDTINKLLPLR